MKSRFLRGSSVGAWGAPVVLFTAYAIALALLAGSSYIDYRNARDIDASGRSVSRTLEAMDKLRQIGNTFFVAESSQRGYLLTGDAEYLAPYHDMEQRIPVRLAEISHLVSATPTQRTAVEKLRDLAAEKFGEMDRMIEAFRADGPKAALAVVQDRGGMNGMAKVREQIRVMLEEESRLLAERRATAAAAYSSGLVQSLVSTVLVGLALTAFYLLMQRFLRQRDAAFAALEASNTELEQRVVSRTADLSHLSRHLLNVREHEKKVIARDLHDEFGSYLTAINMDVSRARDKIQATNPEQATKLVRTLKLLNSAIEMKRQLIADLRPSILDNLGLGPALEQYIDEWSRRTGIAATFDHDGELVSDDEGGPIAIFRIFQEALSNIARHSKATRVAAYAYRVGDTIEFEIADDGIGITDADRTKPNVHGLLGIRERVVAYGGHLDLLGGSQGGTVIRATMPCIVTKEGQSPPSFPLQFA